MKNVDNIALILQALSLEILFRDYNNVDLMQELQMQDEKYLKEILNNQKKILEILDERSKYDGRKIKE